MKLSTEELGNILEALVDAHDLDTVVQSLAGICYEKAAHIEQSYSDAPLAAKWHGAGQVLEDIVADITSALYDAGGRKRMT